MLNINKVVLFLLFACARISLFASIDSTIIHKHFEAGAKLIGSKPLLAEQILRYALQESKSCDNQYLISKCYLNLAKLYLKKAEFDTCLFLWQTAFDIANHINNQSIVSSLLMTKGHYFEDIGQLDSSIYYHLKSLRLSEIIDDKDGTAKELINIGRCYALSGKHLTGRNYLYLGLAQGKKIKNKTYQALSCENIANSYSETQSYDSALIYYKDALDLFISLKNTEMQYEIQLNIGSTYDAINNFEKAIETYKKCIDWFTKSNSEINLAICYENLGVSLIKLEKYGLALENLKNAYQVSIAIRNIENLRSITYNLSIVYAKLDKFKEAYDFRVLNNHYNDSFNSMESARNIEELNTEYQTEKKEQENLLLKKDVEIENQAHQELVKQRRMLVISLGSITLILALLIYIYLQRYRKQKILKEKNEQIHQQHINELLKSQELNSINAMLEGEEKERARISVDLHDRLGALLSTIKLGFSSMESKMGAIAETHNNQFSTTLKLIDQAVDEVRIISHNLASSVLVNFGLEVTLQDLKETIETNTPVKMHVVVIGLNNTRLSPNFEIAIYRIIQELLNNTLKHAKATQFNVELTKSSQEIILIVSDNGEGFDIEKAKVKGGMGLKNLESRVSKLKGAMHIDTNKGNGSTFVIEIPLV